MVTYKYSAISQGGQKVNGVVEGYNEFDAVDRIKESCSIVLKLTEIKDPEEGASLLTADLNANKLDAKAFTMMCSQFAIILRSGVPISRTVQLIAQKTTNKPLKRMLRKVADDVESGRSLSAAFAERGEKLLPPTFIETVRAGEESGNLDSAFESVYEHYDKSTKMAAKVRGAMIYPIFVLVIAVAVVIVLMVKVVPTFTEIFDSMDAELPAMTQLLINISDFFRKYWMIIVAVIAVIIIGVKIYGKSEQGRLNLSKLSLKIPVLGNINLLNAASQFANTMTMMLGAGLPMTRSVSITARVMSNYYISQEIGKLTGKMEEGKTLGSSLREADVLPDILTDMVAVGEETGEMEGTLRTISGYYDTELAQATSEALAKLEPAILVVLAVVAGFIVIAMYLAMFEMYNGM